MMNNIMVDIETLSTSTDAVILSIGAVFFDIEANKLGPEYFTTLHIQDQLDRGRKISESTLRFWLDQDRAVFKQALKPPSCSDNAKVLTQFIQFLTHHCDGDRIKPWGNSNSFDLTLLESLFAWYGLKEPWRFSDTLDLRTFKTFVGGGKKIEVPANVKHDALIDARYQAQYVLEILNTKK